MVCNYLDLNNSCTKHLDKCSCIHYLELELNDIVEFVIYGIEDVFGTEHPCKTNVLVYLLLIS